MKQALLFCALLQCSAQDLFLEKSAFAECPTDGSNGGCCVSCEYNLHCPANGGCYKIGQPGCPAELCPGPTNPVPEPPVVPPAPGPEPAPSNGNPALALIEGLSKGLFDDETLSNCIGHVAETVPAVTSSIDGLFKALLSFKPLRIVKAIKDVRKALKDVPQELQDCGANLQDVKDLLATLEETVPALIGEFASAKDSLDQKNYEDFGEHVGKAVILLIGEQQPNLLHDPEPPASAAGNPALEVIIGLSDGLFGDHGLSTCIASVLQNTDGAKAALGDLTNAVKSKNIFKMVKAIKELKQVLNSIPDSLKPCGDHIEAVKNLAQTLTKVGSEFVHDNLQAFQSLKAHQFGDFGEYIGKALRIIAVGDEPDATSNVVV